MTVLYILLAIVVLLLMIVIHEFGHYIAGKVLKFKINEFAVGFGPAIFSKTNKKTGEKFSLRLIPLGGFCAFEGEDELEERRKAENAEKIARADVFEQESEVADSELVVNPELKTFNEQAPWKRIIVLVSGALFNFISAILFSVLFLAIVGVARPVVIERYSDANGVVYNSQIEVSDVIYAVNGEQISPMKSYDEIMQKIDGDQFTVTVLRNGDFLDVTLTKKEIVTKDQTYHGFGIVTRGEYQTLSFWDSLKYCVPYTFKLSWLILGTFGQLITGQIPLSSMSGPVSTVTYMAELTSASWLNLLILLPLIASNLAIFNLLPIPALDGSKILFTIIEWIRKKPINRTIEAYIHLAGMIALLAFVAIVEVLHFLG